MNCLRCSGLIVKEYDVTRCVNCGYFFNPPHVEPIMTNPFRQWRPDRCEMCGLSARRGKKTCLGCAAKERGQTHPEAVRQGMEQARGRG